MPYSDLNSLMARPATAEELDILARLQDSSPSRTAKALAYLLDACSTELTDRLLFSVSSAPSRVGALSPEVCLAWVLVEEAMEESLAYGFLLLAIREKTREIVFRLPPTKSLARMLRLTMELQPAAVRELSAQLSAMSQE
jgi:hypothetical protein